MAGTRGGRSRGSRVEDVEMRQLRSDLDRVRLSFNRFLYFVQCSHFLTRPLQDSPLSSFSTDSRLQNQVDFLDKMYFDK